VPESTDKQANHELGWSCAKCMHGHGSVLQMLKLAIFYPMNSNAGTFYKMVSSILFMIGALVALAISSTDGFISRLLKQEHHAAPAARTDKREPAQPDQLSISSQARQATQPTGGQRLESRLIDLYNQEGKSAS